MPLVASGQSYLWPGMTIRAGVYMRVVPSLIVHCPGIPDYRTLYLSELRLFYDSIREMLETLSKPDT